MGEVTPLRLVPNPSSDRKVLEFELTLLTHFEKVCETVVDKVGMIHFLANAALKGEPPPRKLLEETLAACEEELPKWREDIGTSRERRAHVQQRLDSIDAAS